jgi:hypothetical protein
LGETTGIHQMEIVSENGEHEVTVVDENGNSASVKFSMSAEK